MPVATPLTQLNQPTSRQRNPPPQKDNIERRRSHRVTRDILRALNGAASLHRGNPACCRSVLRLALPRSAGRVSTLARERPVALPPELPSAIESSPRGFSTWLSPWRSCLTAHPPARFTPFRGQPITRASRAPQTWVECGPTPAVATRRESAEPVCKSLARPILIVGVPGRPNPMGCGTELTRFTTAVSGGIPSPNQDRYLATDLSVICGETSTMSSIMPTIDKGIHS